ncbi:unnamed protein product [Arctogadus glacialis]
MDNSFGPLPYDFEPASREGEQQPPNRGRHHGYRREIELWCQENQWRIGQVSWCLCGKCQPMSSAEESMCCREVDPFWALVETLNPRPDVTCLTLHPGFEGCCLNPFVLQVAYLAFKQEHGPLQASTHEYVQLSTFLNKITIKRS